jgi:crotonobetainyl-CoA:carnitine CoA-transferase CaiB-like acyl-CoA transferase
VTVVRPASGDGPLNGAGVPDLSRSCSGPVSALIRVLLGAKVISIDEIGCRDSVRFSTAFCMWLQAGGPLL